MSGYPKNEYPKTITVGDIVTNEYDIPFRVTGFYLINKNEIRAQVERVEDFCVNNVLIDG